MSDEEVVQEPETQAEAATEQTEEAPAAAAVEAPAAAEATSEPAASGDLKTSNLVSVVEADLASVEAALKHLKTSSNSEIKGTIVGDAVAKFDTAIANLKSSLAALKTKL